jgi:3-phenylpropionate/trans-cinnamate dioxygenase ferredoxin component
MTDLVPVARLDALREGEVFAAMVNGQFIALYLLDGTPYCTEDVCTHEYTSLSESGSVDGDEVECGEHGARFNIKTGQVTRAPAIGPIRTFAVEVRDNQVFVRVD